MVFINPECCTCSIRHWSPLLWIYFKIRTYVMANVSDCVC